MKSVIEVNVQVRMSLDESLELEKSLASGVQNQSIVALTEALRVQNSVGSRLRATGALAPAAA